MEPVGVAIGAVGLISLFSTCIEGFQLVEKGKYLGKDFDLLETKFGNQRLRLKAWGQACGLTDSEYDDYDSRLDEAELRSNIERTLNHIMITLQNQELLKNKYGLKEHQVIERRFYLADQETARISWMHLNAATWRDKFYDFKHRIDKAQHQASFSAKARWAIGDKKKFAELVGDLKDLIDDLETLTTLAGFSDIIKRQREIISRKVACMNDIETLTTMQEACEGHVDAVCNAATFRLSQLHQPPYLEEATTVINENTTLETDEVNPLIPDLQDWSIPDTQFEQNSDAQEITAYHVLHRVKCHQSASVRLFFDPPTNATDQSEWTFLGTVLQSPQESEEGLQEKEHRHLTGQRLLHNLEAYLEQNSTLCFIIFQDYECCQKDDRNVPTLDAKYSPRLLSQDLCEALTSLPWGHLQASIRPKFTVDSELHGPFVWFYHSREAWKPLKDSHGAMSYGTLVLLLDCIGHCMSEEHARVDSLLRESCISYQYLEYIFHAGTILLEEHKPAICDARAYRQVSALETFNVELQVHVGVQSVASNTDFFTATQNYVFDLPSKDKLKITDLCLYPLRYALDATKCRLIERGKKFRACREMKYVSYTGCAPGLRSIHANRFIIDGAALTQMNLIYIEPERQHGTENVPIGFQNLVELEDSLVLLPPTLTGFSLSTQNQLDLHVFQIEPVEWTQHPLIGLDIDRDMKHLLLSVLPDSASATRQRARGHETGGTTVLLQGGPGTGKTYIIDVLAEAAKRPLHRVNLVDIATTPAEFSKSLETISASQVAWGCVVHLMAVDIFVERIATLDARIQITVIFLDFVQKSSGLLFISANREPSDDSLLGPVIDLKVSTEEISQTHRTKVWIAELAAARIAIGSRTYRAKSDLEDIDAEDRFILRELMDFRVNDRQIQKAVDLTWKIASRHGDRPGIDLLMQVLKLSSGRANSYASKP